MKHKPSASVREISSLKPTQPPPLPQRSNRQTFQKRNANYRISVSSDTTKNANCRIYAHIYRARRSPESVVGSRKSEVSCQTSVIRLSGPKSCCRREEIHRVVPSIRAINITRSLALCPSGEQRHLCIFREQRSSAFYFIPFLFYILRKV